MRTRDAGILLVSGLAVFLALETANDFDVKKRWSLELKPTLFRNGRFAAEHERVPKPIIDDVDGDGVTEVLVITREPKLKMLDPQHAIAGSAHGLGLPAGEMHLRVKAETTLLSKGVGNVRSGRQAVAMATGYLDPATDRRRHKYVVVLTHDWTVMCFDRHLKLLWESNPVKMKVAHAFHTEAAIYVVPSKLRPFDKGLVVVGGAMEYEEHNRLHRRKPRKDKAKKGARDTSHESSKAESKKMRQRNKIKAMLGLPIQYDPEQPEWEDDHDEIEETLHHFNYFAFEGKRGALRWHNRATDFQPLGFDHEVTVPQNNYKLELHNQYKHVGEADWRHYRNSLLRSLPHKWVSKEDTRFYTAHFAKNHKHHARGDAEAQQADAAHARDVGFHAVSDPVRGVAQGGGAKGSGARFKHRRRATSAKIGAVQDRRGGSRDAAAKVLHPPKHANVLVAHRKEGIEVLHLHTGRPLLELPLPAGMVHTDLNKDGSVDRVEAVVSEHSVIRPEGHRVSDAEEHANQCYAWVTTGTPPTHALYNESICQPRTSPMATMMHMMFKAQQAGKGGGGDSDANLKLLAAPPAVLRRRRDREEWDRNVDMQDAVFLMNDGLVTSINYAGVVNWQLQTPVTFMQPAPVRIERHTDALLAGEEATPLLDMPMAPTLAAIHLRAAPSHTDEEHILALGMHSGAIVTQDGELLAGFSLPDVPTGPAVIGDFDRDGYNDLIFTTRTAIVGMSITPQKQRKSLSFLLGGLLALVFAAVMVHHATLESSPGPGSKSHQMRRRPKTRATD